MQTNKVDFFDYRVFYKKTDIVKYTSHLDVNRCLQRALKRSKLPVWYSEGFNPHIYLNFALPLSLGFESDYEILDFRLTQKIDFDTLKQVINQAFPPGFEVFKIASPIKKPKEIVSADFEIYLNINKQLQQAFKNFILLDEIKVEKKGKKGIKTINLKEFFTFKNDDIENGLYKIIINFPAGVSTNINPTLLIDNFFKSLNINDYLTKIKSMKRTAVYDENNNLFI
ncbi:MAG: TIGR03936 family radical SAM-associated protein [Oscillospiraceae bacterium]